MSQELDASKIGAALERAAQRSVQGGREAKAGRFMAPRAFISYSHDSLEHKAWVLKLGSDLRSMGVDVILDQWDLVPGQDVSSFMQKGIAEADRVVMVCSSSYVSKSEQGTGGVGYERLIVTAEVVQSIDTIKFIPILREANQGKKLPIFLGPRLYIDFENDSEYESKLIELAREIHGAPAISKPALGSNPFSESASTAPSIVKAPMIHNSEKPLLESEWFKAQQAAAQAGIKHRQLKGQMELRAGISDLFTTSQLELLNAVKHSEIRTFGWPIGVTLENRDENRPRPFGDGIKAEVSIGEEVDGRTSYDYWALRLNGDFFLLQSLFEESRRPNEIFFDTRIVRVTESLMFLERLYTKLGAPPESKVTIRITHRGLKGRTLSSASPNRSLFARTSQEDTSSSELVTVLGSMRETRVNDVRKIVAPMFMLFDYMELNVEVYEDIVRNFEAGKVG